MGLDSIWHLPQSIEPPPLSVPLVGGMLSGPESNVCTSFRGKVYSDFVNIVTGYTLYEETLTQEDVKAIATDLRRLMDELNECGVGYKLVLLLKERFGEEFDVDEDLFYGLRDLEHLTKMFEAYSHIRGVELRAWY